MLLTPCLQLQSIHLKLFTFLSARVCMCIQVVIPQASIYVSYILIYLMLLMFPTITRAIHIMCIAGNNYTALQHIQENNIAFIILSFSAWLLVA